MPVSKSSPIALGSNTNPFNVVSGTWSRISAGFSNSLAINSIDDNIYGWGSGFATNAIAYSPKSWAVIDGGSSYTTAIRSDGLLFAWGLNTVGQLGDGTTVNKSSPVQIGSSSWTNVAGGNAGSHTVGVTTDGALYAWGLNTVGQLGDNTLVSKSSPVRVLTNNFPTGNSITQIFVGDSHAMVLEANGGLYVWGDNLGGQLGSNNTTTILRNYPYSWSQVVSGLSTSAAIRSDGGLFAWGLGTSGQIGDGTTISKSSPVQIGTSSWTSVNLEGNALYAIHSNSSLFAWGLNTSGQLGDGTTVSKSSPVKIGADSWLMVSAGISHVSAINSTGYLFSWGANDQGQLGDESGFSVLKSSPVLISSSNTFTDVAAGNVGTFAIRDDGALFAWGNNTVGLMGNGTTTGGNYFRTETGTGLSAISITIGGAHGILRSDGTLFTWGLGSVAGLGHTNVVSTPTKLVGQSWTKVMMGLYHTLAIASNGALYGWGNNTVGQLADGTTINKSSPVKIGSDSWIAVATGQSHSVGITSNGALYAWGLGTSGQLGDGTTVNKSSPVQIGSDSWISVSAGYRHTNAVNAEGKVYGWGFYQGNGTGGASPTSPTLVYSYRNYNNINAHTFVSVTSAGDTTYALSSNGNFWGWGSGIYSMLPLNVTGAGYGLADAGSWSQVSAGSATIFRISAIDSSLWGHGYNVVGCLGDGTTIAKSSPIKIGSLSWNFINAAYNATYGITSNGALYAWGYNISGILGDGTTILKSSPVKIGSDSWTMVTATAPLTSSLGAGFGIVANGALYTWGNASNGQLGDGTSTNRSSPVQVGSQSWAMLSAGNNHVLAIHSNGALYAWGYNAKGQLGDGTVVTKSSPVQIGSRSWLQISAAYDGAIGLTTNNELFSWGDNVYGTLGDGTTVNKSSPVKIGTESWIVISAEAAASGAGSNLASASAIHANGSLFTWGNNGNGQLGDGTTVNKSSPVKIGASSWTAISSSFGNRALIQSNGVAFVMGGALSGALGNGTTTPNRSSPVVLGQVIGDSAYVPTLISNLSWTQVSGIFEVNGAVNYGGGAGILANGALYTWGANFGSIYGQLGDSTTGNKSSPVKIGSDSWSLVSAGTDIYPHTVAVNSAGYVYVWGNAANSPLGDGTTINKSSPVLIGATAVRHSPIQIGTSSWSVVDAGFDYALAIASNGALYAWGNNATAQLGDGTTANKSSPVKIGAQSWIAVAAGDVNSSGLTTNGQAYVWGNTALGQLGNGLTVGYKDGSLELPVSPLAYSDGELATAIILANGALYTWGNNNVGGTPINAGMLGDGTTTLRSSPVKISGSESWTKVSGLGAHMLGITSNGALYAWGGAASGALGDGSTVSKSSPVKIGSDSWTAVATGVTVSLAIHSNGALYAWGFNANGQLGDGTTVDKSVPTKIGAESWSSISADRYGAAAIHSNGALYVWGLNSVGQIGDGTTVSKSSPVKIGNLSWTIIEKEYASYGILANGQLYVWGENINGQLGDGTTVNKSSPVLLSATYSWTSVGAAANGNYTFATSRKYAHAISSNGEHFAWGNNAIGGLADGTTINKSSPIKIGTSSWTSVGSRIGVYANGLVAGWENFGSSGWLGDGTTVAKSSPVYIGTLAAYSARPNPLPGVRSYTFVAAGQSFLSGIQANGQMYAWGADVGGQLGDGTTLNKSSPVVVGPTATSTQYPQKFSDLSWTKISASQNTSAGIASNGALYAWGYNAIGGMGDGTTVNKSSPVQIGSLSWSQIAIGSSASIGLTSNSALYAWGINSQGAVGDGTTIARSSPVKIGSSSWNLVTHGDFYSLGIDINGALYAWGYNNQGQLGDGTTVAKSSPVRIGAHGFTHLKGGSLTGYALKHNTDLFVWGYNVVGQLGDGTTVNKSTPVYLELDAYNYGANTYTISPTIVGTQTYGEIATGNNYFLATTKGPGIIHVWGLNSLLAGGNRLGYPATYVSVPTAINAGLTAANVIAGNLHSAAIDK